MERRKVGEKKEQRRMQGASPLGTMNMDSIASRRNRHWDDKKYWYWDKKYCYPYQELRKKKQNHQSDSELWKKDIIGEGTLAEGVRPCDLEDVAPLALVGAYSRWWRSFYFKHILLSAVIQAAVKCGSANTPNGHMERLYVELLPCTPLEMVLRMSSLQIYAGNLFSLFYKCKPQSPVFLNCPYY